MYPSELEQYLHTQIPPSEKLAIGVKSCNEHRVELTAPLSANLNHKNTAFGGSLSMIAILAGWSIVLLQLKGIKNEIVIQESNMTYLKAGKADFSAISLYESNPNWTRFMKSFNRYGKGRVSVISNVYCNEKLIAKHEGIYVAIRQ